MIASLSTSCLFHLPLRSIMRLAAHAGYDGIELVVGPEAWLLGPRRTSEMAERFGLVISSIHQSLWPITPAGPGNARMLDAAQFAREMGCPTVVIHGPWSESWHDNASQHWLHTLSLAQEALAASNTRLALEIVGVYKDEDRDTLLSGTDELMGFCTEHDLDITLDTCHVGMESPSLLETYHTLAERVTNIHFSDLRRGLFAGHEWLNSIDSHHQLPGVGRLALDSFVQAMGSDGYTGPITIEVSPTALQAWSPRRMRDNLYQSKAFIEKTLACLK